MMRPYYRRWYALPPAVLPFALLALLVVPTAPGALAQALDRTFYIPSESMNPTLVRNDRLLGRMHKPSELRRGMVVLVDVDGPIYIVRVAALAGDRVEMINGELYLNGTQVSRRLVGVDQYESGTGLPGPTTATRYVEQFPGETGTHEIYDIGRTPGDDYGPAVIPPGHVFLLGDNRDNSADSRFPRDMMGVGIIPTSEIVGIATSIFWRPDVGFVNIPLNRD